MLNWFKNIFKKEQPDYKLELIDEIEGVKFFRFDNELQTPYCRTAKAFVSMEDYKNLGIHRDDLTKALDIIAEANRKGDRDNVATIVTMLKAYQENELTDSILFNLAEPLILIEGEQLDNIDAQATMKKKQLCESSEVIKGFFLRMGHAFLFSLLNTSIGHLKTGDYFNNKEQRRIEKIFSQLIQRNIHQSLEKKLT